MNLETSLSGGHRRGATPVPIPNTEVKPSTGDGTNGAIRWESSKLPGFIIENPRVYQARGFSVFRRASVRLDDRQGRLFVYGLEGSSPNNSLKLIRVGANCPAPIKN